MSTQSTVKLYSEDFKKFHSWNQICAAAGIDSNCDQLVLIVSKAEGFLESEKVLKKSKESTVKLYAEDFKKFHVWNQACTNVGVDSNYDQLVLTISKAEGFIEADQEEIENFEEEDLL